MILSKLYTIELTDGTEVDVEVYVDVDDKFCENNEHSYIFDDAGLTDEQICEVESIVDNSIEEWAEAMLLGEDDEYNFEED